MRQKPDSGKAHSAPKVDPLVEAMRVEAMTVALLKESDRGCVIFGTAYLSDALEKLLRSVFRSDEGSIKTVVNPMFSTYAPLSTMASRIDMAYCLKLISRDVWVKLHAIRKLRNLFAHESGPVDFEDSRCRSHLFALTGNSRPEIKDTEKRLFGNQMLTKEEMVRRLTFTLLVIELLARIFVRTEIASKGYDIRAIAETLKQNKGHPQKQDK